jgi:hypothetical protein
VTDNLTARAAATWRRTVLRSIWATPAIARTPWPVSHSLNTSLIDTTDTSRKPMHHLQLAAFGGAYFADTSGRRISGVVPSWWPEGGP